MRADTLHLTLAFIGDVPLTTRERLLAELDSPVIAPFELAFERFGHWRHNRIGWLGPEPSPALAELAGALRERLTALGVPFDDKPFAAHVTLLRNTRGGEPPPCQPLRWAVADFALVESRPDEQGAHYTVLRRWPLTAGNAAPGLG